MRALMKVNEHLGTELVNRGGKLFLNEELNEIKCVRIMSNSIFIENEKDNLKLWIDNRIFKTGKDTLDIYEKLKSGETVDLTKYEEESTGNWR